MSDPAATTSPDTHGGLELPTQGPSAPPRTNGEIIFDAPWQSRAFGVAAALADTGRLSWPNMQAALIERIAIADIAGHDTGTPLGYWTCWVDALATVADRTGVVDTGALAQRADEFAARPAGHDHSHHRDHHHDHHDHHHDSHHQKLGDGSDDHHHH